MFLNLLFYFPRNAYTTSMRLNKYISTCGVASRRKADDLIVQGRVRVNDQVVQQLGVIIDPGKDTVSVNGQRCIPAAASIYLALNKPKGYVSTSAVFEGEQSIFQLLPKKFAALKIAGRLDKDSEGLVILSNDGDFIYTLTHPKFTHEKEYEVISDKPLAEKDLNALRRGVRLTEGRAVFDQIRPAGERVYHVVIHQGWKRQIRRMFENLGFYVKNLRRIREGKLQLGDLPLGQHRLVKREDIV